MKDDFKWIGISSDDDEFCDASVKGLGGLIGSLLDLLEGGALRDQIKDLRGELLSSKWLCTFRNFLSEARFTIVVEVR